jgi:hypothetical protein
VISKEKGGDIMASKKDLVIAILATFCLTITLFFVIPTRSSPASSDYDPWCDVNDDGYVDMADISTLIEQFMASGNPTKNVTILGARSDILIIFDFVEIDPGGFQSAEIAVDDYKTLHVWMWSWDVGVGNGHVNVRWVMPYGVSACYFPWDSFDFTDGLYAIKTYEVIGPRFEVTIYNNHIEPLYFCVVAFAKTL